MAIIYNTKVTYAHDTTRACRYFIYAMTVSLASVC